MVTVGGFLPLSSTFLFRALPISQSCKRKRTTCEPLCSSSILINPLRDGRFKFLRQWYFPPHLKDSFYLAFSFSLFYKTSLGSTPPFNRCSHVFSPLYAQYSLLSSLLDGLILPTPVTCPRSMPRQQCRLTLGHRAPRNLGCRL